MKFAFLVRIERKVHPPKLLKRRHGARNRRVRRLLELTRETNAISHRPKLIRLRFSVFDCKADKIARWLAGSPIHREQYHPVATMNLESEWCFGIGACRL